jgi:3-phosphoshikimate 1-carboxyvinyltransferase
VDKTSAFPSRINIKPVGLPLAGGLAVPGGKSMANRSILLAGAAHGESRLGRLPDSADVRAAISVLAELGVPARREGGVLVLPGRGLAFPNQSGEIHLGASGTVGRFLPGLLAAAPVGAWRLVSSPQLAARPLRPLLDALRQWGAALEPAMPNRSFPLEVRGGGLSGGTVVVSAAASSQFASGVLLAAPLCRRPARVVIRDLDPEETYIDMTLELMRRFGVEARAAPDGSDLVVLVDAPASYRAAALEMEADANTAAYFLALAALTGSRIAVTNLDPASRQPGTRFLGVLSRLGCAITASPAGVTAVGGPVPLRGGFSLDMRAMAELAVTLGVLAVFADRPIRLTNLAHIRGHESDRLSALSALLGQAGAVTEEAPDGITVHPLRPGGIRRIVVDPRDDHRLAMSFALLGAAANGVGIENPGCVAKTCPGFFRMLADLGVGVDPAL